MTDQLHEIEVEAKTTAEAIRKALRQLKAKRDDVNIEVVCEEEKGLFGMEGAKMAKVKATLKQK